MPLMFTPATLSVLDKRYLLKNDKGEVVETPEELFLRVARAIAAADKLYTKNIKEIKKTEQEFFDVMTNFEFLCGMALPNAGRKIQQLSACYVLPIDDSMDSIYETLKNAAFLHKTGAGIGYDFSRIRSEGDIVSTTGGRASGPISFMRLFDFSTEVVVNDAALRRGGNMGILRVDHPDIVKFINCKRDYSQLNNFNISVAVTEKFMEAVTADKPYELIDPHSKKAVKKIKAREIFDLIAQSAHKSAEPGIIFIDEVNRYNPTPAMGRIEATNLCGEQPLLAHEACNIGSVVLSRMLKVNGDKKKIDWDKLEKTIYTGVHFLDNTLDINYYPLPEIKAINIGNRKIGLGVMGFADLLYELEIPYNSEKALKLAEDIMKFISLKSKEASIELAKKRGSFPNFKKSIWPKKGFKKLRNATTTTIAPTGTTSMFANCSSGVEPVFALGYVRKNFLEFGKDEYMESNPIFERVAKEKWFYSQELMQKVIEYGSAQKIDSIPEDVRKVFVVSHDVSPEWHIKIQAAFQKYTDNAVSKTVNMRQDTTVEDVKEVFILAYKSKCKGVTIYRDKSRDKQVLNIKA